jgi:hypothetical protein
LTPRSIDSVKICSAAIRLSRQQDFVRAHCRGDGFPGNEPQRFYAAYRKAGGDIALVYIDAERPTGRSPDLSQTGDLFALMVEFIGRHVR